MSEISEAARSWLDSAYGPHAWRKLWTSHAPGDWQIHCIAIDIEASFLLLDMGEDGFQVYRYDPDHLLQP